MEKSTSKIYAKLGEVLLKENIITAEQLKDVLKQQIIYGTRIGSSLIEMGYVDEASLAHLLSVKLGVPVAGQKELMSVSKELIRTFSAELILKYHVMPFRLDRNRLSLAMTDPTDIQAIDEIAFITGYVVQPFIALDVNISKAQAKYFQINSGERRYQLMSKLRLMSAEANAINEEKESAPVIEERVVHAVQVAPSPFEDFASLNAESESECTDSEQSQKSTLEGILREFASASTRDAVADALVRYLSQEFSACMMLIVRGTVAVGWRGIINGTKIVDLADLNLLLGKPSVVQDLVDSRDSVVGPLLNTPVNRQILDVLGIRVETPMIVQPVLMLNKVVAVIMVPAEMEVLVQRLDEVRLLSREASLAFEMLIIKNKIMMI
jgi:hypothetical protein